MVLQRVSSPLSTQANNFFFATETKWHVFTNTKYQDRAVQ